MKKFIWWTAAGLLAVIVLCGALTCGVWADTAENRQETGTEEAEAEAAETEAEAEAEALVLTGQVLHTGKWEENRQSANRFYEAHNRPEDFRGQDTFWSGERFILQAVYRGEKPPASVTVRIEGTGYETRLMLTDGIYRGEMFEPDLLYRRGQTEPENLEFLFEAKGGLRARCTVIIDDRDPYWLLHRKE